MNTLPKWIKFIIFNYFSQTELYQLRYVSKTWHADISNKSFWEYKVRLLTGQCFENNTSLPGKLWYDRYTQSEKLYRALRMNKSNRGLLDAFTVLDNVCSYRRCGCRHYYLTPDGALYYQEKGDNDKYIQRYGFMWDWTWEDTYHFDGLPGGRACGSWCPIHQKNVPGLGNLLCETSRTKLTSVDQISNVNDIIPTYIGDFILTFDSKLYMIGTMSHSNKLTYHSDNVKSINGCGILFCYLTWDNKLWVYLNDKFVLQANDVISANIFCCCENEFNGFLAKLYYLKANGKLWCRCGLDISEIQMGIIMLNKYYLLIKR